MSSTPTPKTDVAYRKGQLVELRITDVAEGDMCFGRLPEGLAVFVRGPVAVGDEAEARVYKIKKNYLEARWVRTLSPSPHRVTPCCPHFGRCGGCKWQHVDYAEQLRVKEKQAVDAFRHIGGFAHPPHEPILPAANIFHYRNKVEFTFSRRRYLLDHEQAEKAGPLEKPADFALGFHAPRLYDKIVDIDACSIAPEAANVALDVAKREARASGRSIYSTKTHEGFLRHLVVRCGRRTQQHMVNLVTSSYDEAFMHALSRALERELGEKLTTVVNNVTRRKSAVAVGDREHVVYGPGVIEEELSGLRFTVSANSFFQTNTEQAEMLYAKALAFAELDPGDVVYDFYSGIGAIALLFARCCRRVLGVEVADQAVRDARANAERNRVSNCSFMHLDLKEVKRALPEFESFGRPDVVVLDPPRPGVHPNVLPVLWELAPRRIVYVSCNPASLARDARGLCEHGRYRLARLLPVDMFPHTNHVESIARFDYAA